MNVVEAVAPRYLPGAGQAPMRKLLPILSAEGLLLTQHRDRLLRYVQSMVRDRGDAEDLLQEILLRAHRGFGTLRAGEAGTTWLFRIATHACLDHLRQRLRRPAIDAGADPDALDNALEAGCSFGCDERGVMVCEPKR